LKMQVKEQS